MHQFQLNTGEVSILTKICKQHRALKVQVMWMCQKRKCISQRAYMTYKKKNKLTTSTWIKSNNNVTLPLQLAVFYTTCVKSKGMFVKTRMSLRTTRRMHQNQWQSPMTTLRTSSGHREWGKHLHAISVKCLTRVTLLQTPCLQLSKYVPALPLQIPTWEEKRNRLAFFFFTLSLLKCNLNIQSAFTVTSLLFIGCEKPFFL